MLKKDGFPIGYVQYKYFRQSVISKSDSIMDKSKTNMRPVPLRRGPYAVPEPWE